MVASGIQPQASKLTAPVPPSFLGSRGGLVRFTVKDVQSMLEQGILPEDATTELLHGLIVRKDRSDLGDEPVVTSNPQVSDQGGGTTVIGKNHQMAVTLLTDLTARVNSAKQHVRIQNPVVCSEIDAPEPDFMIVRGSIRSFAGRIPTGQDVSCVIEVADSSLERDAEVKMPIYAAAGIPQYIVLNLRDRHAQVFSTPDQAKKSYPPPTILPETGTLQLLLASGETLAVPLTEVLP